MRWQLIESQRTRDGKGVLGGLVSLVFHTTVITGLVYATLSARRSDSRIQFDTTLVMVAPAERQAPPPQPTLDPPLKGFQNIVVPDVIPTAIPHIDLQEHFNPKDYSGVGVEGGTAGGLAPGADEVFSETVVDEVPMLLAAPAPEYPSLLRQAGITGRVVLQAIVDTTGRAEPSSIKVVESPNVGFERASRQWMLKALFRPARLRGRPVRVYVHLPLDFTIAGRAGS